MTKAKKIHPVFRQGDVFVQRIDKLPKAASALPRDGHVILAYGEVTGHAHRIKDPGVCMLSCEGQTDRYLTVAGEAFLTHEEHATIPLGTGSYRVRIQREYNWAEEVSHAVAD